MKNIIKLLLLIILYATVISQVNFNTIREKISLKGPVQLSDSVQSNLIIEQLLQLYGTSLEYYYELKSGSYIVTLKNSNEYKTEINSGASFQEEYRIKMDLAKNEYTNYEPILAKFEIVNNDLEPLELDNIFSPILNKVNFVIKDENGKVSSKNKFPISIDYISMLPSYVINPGETLYVSMEINNWGEVAFNPTKDEEDNNIYFGQMMHFKPGKYKVYATFNVNDDNDKRWNKKFITNEISFEVRDNTEEEKNILKLYKQKQYDEILNNYPSNLLTEYVFMTNILSKHIDIFNSKSYDLKEKLESDYLSFMNTYPNSYYLLNDWFLKPLIYKIFYNVTELNSSIINTKNIFQNDFINLFLNTKSRIEATVGKKNNY